MIGRWIKASFLAVLGIVILLYADKFVQDLEVNASQHMQISFIWTWDLITWLLWVLVAWLFVDAALTVALSVSEQKHTIGEVSKRLERIERKLGIQEEEAAGGSELETVAEEAPYSGPAPEEEPPPPV